jgi:hypothetical protein
MLLLRRAGAALCNNGHYPRYGRQVADDFTERYASLLTGSYDCVDRIVLNACFSVGHNPGGFWCWWRRLLDGHEYADVSFLPDAIRDELPLPSRIGAVRVGTRRYQVPPGAARTITALLALRDHVIAPILAGVRSPGPDTSPLTGLASIPITRPSAPACRPSSTTSGSARSRRRIDNIC